jgi:hypothetical protein
MPNYQKGKIYKIVDNTNDNIYIGSTCEKLIRRLQKHKASYKCYLNPNVKQGHMRSFDIIKNGDFNIILLEECPCENKEQLLAREQYWKDKMKCVNHNNPIHNHKKYQQEWRDNNREHYNQKSREWGDKNKQKKSDTGKLYRYSLSVGNINKIDIDLFI